MIIFFGFSLDHLFLNERYQESDLRPAQIKILKFEDQEDGGVTVIDANTNQVIDVVQGEAGFVRGTLRGLAQERKRRGLDSGPPFELIYRADGRLTLSDTATGRLVDLESFGPTNASTFFKLFNASNVVAVSKS